MENTNNTTGSLESKGVTIIVQMHDTSKNTAKGTFCCCRKNSKSMEDSNEYKLHSGTSCCPCLPKKLQPHVPNSRKVFIVLLWISLTHSIYNYTIFNIGGILDVGDSDTYPLYVIGITQLLVLLLYPLAGLLGEVYWTRFKTLLTSTIIMLISIFIAPALLVGLSFVQPRSLSLSIGGILIAVFLIPFQIGLAVFESNVIQFGTDQLLFASSDQLSNFVHWSFWCMYLIPALTVIIFCPFNIPPITVSPVIEVIALIILLVVIMIPCTRGRLEKQNTSKTNPVKLVSGVLKYVKNNKYPARRSAFTYNDEEDYCRVNFAKKRYGGPYTTEQVEDVKSFIRISILLLSLFGFFFIDNTGVFVQQYQHIGLITATSGIMVPAQCIVSNFGITFIVILFGVPVHKLLLTPFFYKYTPNMIKRMGLGLFITFISLLIELIISVLLNNAFDELGYVDVCGNNITQKPDNITFPSTLINYYILLIPQALNGFSLLLVFLTSLEFILAQAPRSMQGLLIGFWYALQSINVTTSTIFSTSNSGCHYMSYVVRAGLAGLSIIAFVITAYWYKGRMKQEITVLKQRTIIEEYTVRNLRPKLDYYIDPYDPYETGSYALDIFSIYSQLNTPL